MLFLKFLAKKKTYRFDRELLEKHSVLLFSVCCCFSVFTQIRCFYQLFINIY